MKNTIKKTNQVLTLPPWLNQRTLFIVLGVLTLFAFFPAFSNGFVWDDVPYVKDNPYIKNMNTGLFTDYWMGNYHPLTQLSLYVDYLIAGETPFWYHMHNIIIHLLVSFIIAMLLKRYTGNELTSWVGAALFAVHPIHVESVAWISERKDVLYGFWFFLALLSWDEFRVTGKRMFQGLALICFLLSCFAKGMAVTLPAIIVLLEYFHYRKPIPVILKDVAAGFIISIIFGLVAINAQKVSSALREGEYYTVFDHTIIGLTGWFLYIWKLLIPYPLSAVYTLPMKDLTTQQFPQIFYICAALFLLVPVLLWKSNDKIRLWILAFTASVAHVLFAPVGSAMAADRYMYVPSFFFIWAMADFLTGPYFLSKVNKLQVRIFPAGIIILVFSWMSFQRTKVWESNFTLFSDVARQYPHDLLANNNIGLHYLKLKEFDKAREAYRRVTHHYPLDYTGYFNMASSYNHEEKGREALNYLYIVEKLNPGYKDLYTQMGIAALFANMPDTAIYALVKARERQPDQLDNVFNLALAYSKKGQYMLSDSLYLLGLQSDPARSNAYLYLAYNAAKQNDMNKEQVWIDNAVKGGLDLGYVLRNIGIMVGEDLDYAAAKSYFEKAVQLDETDGEAWYNLAISHEKMGDLQTAIPMYQQSARLKFDPAIELLNRNKVSY